MKKTAKALLFVLILTLSLMSVTSCEKYDSGEILSSAKDLISESYEINEIFFGYGIKCDREDVENAKTELDEESDVKKAVYVKADAASGYSCVKDIKTAALKVYSEDYCEIIFSNAFSGIRDSSGNIVEYSRYIDDEFGRLTVRVDIENEAVNLNRTYDFETLKILRQGNGYALVEVLSICDGEESDTIRLKLVMTEDGWRLDTPTY